MAVLYVDFRKYSGQGLADNMTPQIITDCGHIILVFMQCGFCASIVFLQTQSYLFPNKLFFFFHSIFYVYSISIFANILIFSNLKTYKKEKVFCCKVSNCQKVLDTFAWMYKYCKESSFFLLRKMNDVCLEPKTKRTIYSVINKSS